MALSKSADEIVNEDESGLLGIAPHWERVKLGDVATVLNGFPFDSAGFGIERGTPVIRIRDVARGATATRFEGEFDPQYLISKGDLLVGMDGDFNAVRWRSSQALLNQRVCKIKVNDSLYIPSLLDHLLPVYLAAINAQTSSVTVKHLSSRTVQDIPLPLPPMAEQVRLTERLNELFSDLSSAENELLHAKRKLTLYRQSLLKSAVDGSLTAEWRQVRTDVTWRFTTIGEIADVGTGVTPLRSTLRYFVNGTIPWVTSGALNEAVVDRAATLVTAAAVEECRLKIYPAGTLLVALYGEGKTRGKCSELGIDATVNQAVATIALRPEFSDYRQFLKAFLWFSYEDMRSQSAGGVQPNLNLSMIKSIQVPLPPLAEQREIVARLDEAMAAVTSQREAINHALKMAAAQRQNILRAAFSGRLVPQDPNDEPASVLLDRIRRQRDATPQPARRQRRARTSVAT